MYTYPEEEGRSRYARDERFTHTDTHTLRCAHARATIYALCLTPPPPPWAHTYALAHTRACNVPADRGREIRLWGQLAGITHSGG